MFGAGWVGCAERAQKKAVDANRPPHGGRGKTEFYNPYSPQPPNLSGIKNDTREQGGRVVCCGGRKAALVVSE